MTVRPPARGSLRARIELGLAAFSPALALLAIRVRDSRLWIPLAFTAALGVLFLIANAVAAATGSRDPFSFDSVEDLSTDILGHVASYLIPLLVDTSAGSEDVAIAMAGLALIIYIHVMTGRVYINPLLYLFGYRVYRATVDGDISTFYLIARTDPALWPPGETRYATKLPASILVERKPQADG